MYGKLRKGVHTQHAVLYVHRLYTVAAVQRQQTVQHASLARLYSYNQQCAPMSALAGGVDIWSHDGTVHIYYVVTVSITKICSQQLSNKGSGSCSSSGGGGGGWWQIKKVS